MARMIFLPRWPQLLLLSFVLLGLLGLRGSEGQAQPRMMRIGLQTKQAEIRLQANVPLRVEATPAAPLTVPAEQTLIFRAQNGGGALFDPNDAQLLQFTTPAQVRIAPANGAAQPEQPLIRVLGPGKHYDGKPDRPYRGDFEIQPRNEGLTVVNIVDIESYLLGVVSSEMSPGYPVEALKAQAMAARSYALKNRGRFAAQGFDLDDTAASQVYGGVFNEDPRTTRAVMETAGQVMTYGGQIIDAVYSSTCGGFTESAEEAWGRPVPYLVSVADYHSDLDPAVTVYPKSEITWAYYFKFARAFNCLQPKYAKPEAFRWVKIMTRKEIEAGLPEQYKVGTLQNIVPLRRGASGRIMSLRLEGSDGTAQIDKELPIRKAFGGLRSSAFTYDVYRDDNGTPTVFAFWGAGWGHGLGMCQVGAVGLAEQGWTYDKILKHYYNGIIIEKR